MYLPKPILILLALLHKILLPINVLLNAFGGYDPSLLQLVIGFFNIGGILILAAMFLLAWASWKEAQ